MSAKKDNLPTNVDVDLENGGTIKYANEVIAIIAGVAASEIDGIAGMCTSGGISDIIGRNRNITRGVKVEVGGEEASVELYIIVEYGSPIQKVASDVQENVRKAIRYLVDPDKLAMLHLDKNKVERRFTFTDMSKASNRVANYFKSNYQGAIMVAAYSYMALVPIIQPPVIKAVTSKKERLIRMKYHAGDVSKTTKIVFPIVVTAVAGLVAPKSVALVGFLMFGNLIRECGVLNQLSETAQNAFANIITILLGLTVAAKMHYQDFVSWQTLMILGLGLVAFIFDTVGGVVFAKFINLFLPKEKKINPMIGAAGISAFPMSGRVVNQMGLKEDPQNFLLMYSISVNVSGQIASVIAGGLILTLVS